MSKNSSAVVPIEAWSYASPDLKINGKNTDIGILCEALLYYDTIYVNLSTQIQFCDLINWLISNNELDCFLSLISDGIIKFLDYGFISTAVEKEGVYSIWNITDPVMAKENSFEQRYLYHESFEKIITQNSLRRRFYRTFANNVIEEKLSSYETSVVESRNDLGNSKRTSLIIQSFVDDLFFIKSLRDVPEIKTNTISTGNGLMNQTVNIDYNSLSLIAGENLTWNQATPYTASANCNKFLKTASNLLCDLYLPSPMSKLVGDKLYEAKCYATKSKEIIESLQTEVEFPSIRQLVNSGSLSLKQILEFRKNSIKFRSWLQQEGTRDRNAIIAYHQETAKSLGLTNFTNTNLKVVGTFIGASLGAVIGSEMGGSAGGTIGALAGTGVSYIMELADKLDSGWKPVFFGDWLINRIKKIEERH